MLEYPLFGSFQGACLYIGCGSFCYWSFTPSWILLANISLHFISCSITLLAICYIRMVNMSIISAVMFINTVAFLTLCLELTKISTIFCCYGNSIKLTRPRPWHFEHSLIVELKQLWQGLRQAVWGTFNNKYIILLDMQSIPRSTSCDH